MDRALGRHFRRGLRTSFTDNRQRQWVTLRVHTEPSCDNRSSARFPRVCRLQCRAIEDGRSDEPTPEALMRKLAAEYGVRVYSGPSVSSSSSSARRVADSVSEQEEDWEDEDEDWEDVVSELGNPWDMRPARVGLLDDNDGFPEARSGAAAATSSATHPSTPASNSPSAGAGTSWYLDPAALPRIDRDELMQLIRGPTSASPSARVAAGGSHHHGSADTSSANVEDTSVSVSTSIGGGDDPSSRVGGTGEARGQAEEEDGAEAGGPEDEDERGSRQRVVLVDVREQAELDEQVEAEADQVTEEAEGAAGGHEGGTGAVRRAPRRSAPGRLPAATLHVPLGSLRRPQAAQLEAAADYVVVLGTGDHRGEQAVVRLTKVYGLRRVLLYDEGSP